MKMAVVFLPRPYRPGDEQDPLLLLNQPLVPKVHVIH